MGQVDKSNNPSSELIFLGVLERSLMTFVPPDLNKKHGAQNTIWMRSANNKMPVIWVILSSRDPITVSYQ